MTLCNTSNVSPTLAEQIATLMLGVLPRRIAVTSLPLDLATGPYATGAFTVPVDSTGTTRRRNDQLAQMAGSYYSDELDLAVSLVARDGALYLRRPKSVDMRFGSFATDLFTSSDKILLRVVRDSRGGVSGLHAHDQPCAEISNSCVARVITRVTRRSFYFRGLARFVGVALSGSSGHSCFG